LKFSSYGISSYFYDDLVFIYFKFVKVPAIALVNPVVGLKFGAVYVYPTLLN
jgi:hypothetical protein